jgi:hypothetical protein
MTFVVKSIAIDFTHTLPTEDNRNILEVSDN